MLSLQPIVIKILAMVSFNTAYRNPYVFSEIDKDSYDSYLAFYTILTI